MESLWQSVIDNSRAIIEVLHGNYTTPGLVVIGKQNGENYMSTFIASSGCTEEEAVLIHGKVVNDALESSQSKCLMFAPLNGYGTTAYNQSMTPNAVSKSVSVTYNLLSIDSNYIPPTNDWVFVRQSTRPRPKCACVPSGRCHSHTLIGCPHKHHFNKNNVWTCENP